MVNIDFGGSKPLIIAGPCAAESLDLMKKVAGEMVEVSSALGFDYLFKASFDKANRTSVDSYRGPGLEEGLRSLEAIKQEFGCSVTTDVHETSQVKAVSEVCDVIQIPAFLCRQTDLLVAAASSGRAVSVKKGQFLDPKACRHIINKVRSVEKSSGKTVPLALMERGSSFGYGNLVVDMRGLKTMHDLGVPVLFDMTHSTQQPSQGEVTGGLRSYAPLLARAALATGYVSGIFMEVHPSPKDALSDAATQLSLEQAKSLLTELVPLFTQFKGASEFDASWEK